MNCDKFGRKSDTFKNGGTKHQRKSRCRNDVKFALPDSSINVTKPTMRTRFRVQALFGWSGGQTPLTEPEERKREREEAGTGGEGA